MLISVQIVDLMEARPGMRDDEFADDILDRKRREMRPHRSSEVVNYPPKYTAEPVNPSFGIAEPVDRFRASGRGKDKMAVPPRQRLE